MKKYLIEVFIRQTSKMTARLKREASVFKQLSRENRLLLVCSTLFSLAGPFIGLFLNIYLWREINSLEAVALFNLFGFLGLPIGFIANGFLLKRVSSKRALQFGLLAQGIFPLTLMILREEALHLLAPLGIISGLSAAFYWANLNLLTYDLTIDEIRGYFAGMSLVFGSVAGIFASPLAGFVIGIMGQKWFQFGVRQSYYLSFLIAAVIFLVTVIIAREITAGEEKLDFSLGGVFATSKSKKWVNVRFLNLAYGVCQGILIFSGGLLAFKFFGRELLVGWFSGLMGAIGMLAGYFAGRYAKPDRRVSAAIIGATFFFIGSMFFGINFSVLGYYVFSTLIAIGGVFIWTVHGPVQMREIDKGYFPESQRYNYLVDTEVFLNIGRILGTVVLIFLANFFDFDLTYRIIIILIGLVPFISLLAVKNLVKN